MRYEESSFDGIWGNANCSDHPQPPETRAVVGAGVTPVVAFSCDGEEYADTDGFAIAATSDGRFIAVEEWSDSSGHGCQCNGTASVWPTLARAITHGLSRGHRDVLASLRPSLLATDVESGE